MSPNRRRDLQTALMLGILLGVGLPTVVFVTVPPYAGPDSDMLPDRPGARWVSIDPIQCMGNPWEEDWLQSHNGSWGSYPQEWEAQTTIVTDYYSGLGIPILGVRQDVWDGEVCEACSCPAGYTLYLQVWDHDVNELVALGFEVVR